MFEKIGRLAEKAATNVDVSRRGFLGRLGKGALAVAGVLGFTASAAGGRHGFTRTCCYYGSTDPNTGDPIYSTLCVTKSKCPRTNEGMIYLYSAGTRDCSTC